MTTDNGSKKWQDDQALLRYRMISPLLDESLDPAAKLELRKKLAEQHHVSPRTFYRYEKAFQEASYDGLKPSSRSKHRHQDLPDNFDELLAEAIQLKKEVPSRSVAQIILILEMEELVAPHVLKRSTLQRHLYNAGFGKKQMKKYADTRKISTKRFCRPHRMELIHADIKYGSKLPLGPNGEKVQTYLVVLIDDHSKLIVSSGFYDNQEKEVVEDAYRQAILQRGIFSATYVDNGKQFVSNQLVRALSQLGIRHYRAKPYSPNSKGRVEVFNRFVNSFLSEIRAHKITTLEELNRYWQLWVDEYYHHKPHDGIREYYESHNIPVPEQGITPQQEWDRDSRPLKYLDAGTVGRAFLHHETRIVDQGTCISFQGRKYETHAALIGAKVNIAYDPMNTESITITYEGIEPFTAHPLKIGSFCDKTPEVPASMSAVEPESSRLLEGLEKRQKARAEQRANAISFSSYRKGGETDV